MADRVRSSRHLDKVLDLRHQLSSAPAIVRMICNMLTKPPQTIQSDESHMPCVTFNHTHGHKPLNGARVLQPVKLYVG